MARVFISHAGADVALVEEFVNLLQTGLDISRTQIFCTSLEGMRIKAGTSFVDSIRKELSGADYVIMLITPQYYESAFCMCELGATWIQGKGAFPLLVPPIGYDNLKAVLHGVQSGKITDEAALNQINDELTEAGIAKPSAGRWQSRRDAFLRRLNASLHNKVPGRSSVPADEHATVKAAYEETQNANDALQEEIDRLKERMRKVEALKDRAEVKKLKAEDDGEAQQFDALVRAFRQQAVKVPAAGIEVLFHEYREESYILDDRFGNDDQWRDAERARKDGYVEIAGHVVTRKEGNPKMRKAWHAIEELAAFMQSASEEFGEEMEEEHEVEFSLSSREFWETVLEV